MFVLLISLIQAISFRKHSKNFGIHKKYLVPKKKYYSQKILIPQVLYQEEENGWEVHGGGRYETGPGGPKWGVDGGVKYTW